MDATGEMRLDLAARATATFRKILLPAEPELYFYANR